MILKVKFINLNSLNQNNSELNNSIQKIEKIIISIKYTIFLCYYVQLFTMLILHHHFFFHQNLHKHHQWRRRTTAIPISISTLSMILHQNSCCCSKSTQIQYLYHSHHHHHQQVFTTITTTTRCMDLIWSCVLLLLVALLFAPINQAAIRPHCRCIVFDDTFGKEYGIFTSPDWPVP